MANIRPISDRFLNSHFNNTTIFDNSQTTNNLFETENLSPNSLKKFDGTIFENFKKMVP